MFTKSIFLMNNNNNNNIIIIIIIITITMYLNTNRSKRGYWKHLHL